MGLHSADRVMGLLNLIADARRVIKKMKQGVSSPRIWEMGGRNERI